jgi:hypothetical protein
VDVDGSPDWNPGVLPYYIWVDFQDKYHEPTFFVNDPEHRGVGSNVSHCCNEICQKSQGNARDYTLTQTMIPLKMAWAWIVWKVQGQTVDAKVVVNLGREEVEHGLSYVAFSCVRQFQDIGIIDGGVSGERLTIKISKQ